MKAEFDQNEKKKLLAELIEKDKLELEELKSKNPGKIKRNKKQNTKKKFSGIKSKDQTFG